MSYRQFYQTIQPKLVNLLYKLNTEIVKMDGARDETAVSRELHKLLESISVDETQVLIFISGYIAPHYHEGHPFKFNWDQFERDSKNATALKYVEAKEGSQEQRKLKMSLDYTYPPAIKELLHVYFGCFAHIYQSFK